MDYIQAPPSAVYIHIPFCTNKCHYCDFNSYVLKGQPVADYLDAMDRELERTVQLLPSPAVSSIFVGGGTPTVLTPEQMERFLSLVNRYFPHRTEDFEFTMEANPGTTDPDKLAVMHAGGVNRISFGVQAFQAGLLERIGRVHNVEDVYRSLANAKQAGFANISIDLMFGLPGQTLAMLEESLEKALELDLQHYSIYGLKVEENTLFHAQYKKGQLPLPEEEVELRMFETIMERLEASGYRQYEISNFARPGFEGRHNSAYWRNLAYYGIGAGAHGYANGERHVNIKGVQPYIDAAQSGLPRLETNRVTREEAMEDFMMVGLRLLEGVRGEDFIRQFGLPLEGVFGEVIAPLLVKGLLEKKEQGYRLTPHSIPYANMVFGAFVGALTE